MLESLIAARIRCLISLGVLLIAETSSVYSVSTLSAHYVTDVPGQAGQGSRVFNPELRPCYFVGA